MDFCIKLSEKNKEELIEMILERDKEIQKLKNELKKYKNPHVPSSSNKHIKPDTLGLKVKQGAKRGAPLGYRGDTIHLPPAEEIIPMLVQECSHCGSENVEPTGYIKEKDVLCLIKPRVAVRKYAQQEIRCINCHKLTLAKHADIPEQGIYDKSIQSLVNYSTSKQET